jgi:hypothetical protein
MSHRLIVMVLCSALMVSGCTTLKPIRVAQPEMPGFGPVKTGDTLVVQTRSGETARFVVRDMTEDTLIAADGRQYTRSDLVTIERRASSGKKTAILVAVGLGVVAVAVMVAVGWWLSENSR